MHLTTDDLIAKNAIASDLITSLGWTIVDQRIVPDTSADILASKSRSGRSDLEAELDRFTVTETLKPHGYRVVLFDGTDTDLDKLTLRVE